MTIAANEYRSYRRKFRQTVQPIRASGRCPEPIHDDTPESDLQFREQTYATAARSGDRSIAATKNLEVVVAALYDSQRPPPVWRPRFRKRLQRAVAKHPQRSGKGTPWPMIAPDKGSVSVRCAPTNGGRPQRHAAVQGLGRRLLLTSISWWLCHETGVCPSPLAEACSRWR